MIVKTYLAAEKEGELPQKGIVNGRKNVYNTVTDKTIHFPRQPGNASAEKPGKEESP